MSYLPIREVCYGLRAYYQEADEAEKVVIECAIAAAAADAVGGIIPIVAIPATIISCFAAVWVMYGRICSKLGISIGENTLKILARAVLANIAGNLGGGILAFLAGMLIPGAAILTSAVVAFIAVYLAGLVFLKLLLKLAEKSEDPYSFSDISESEMKKTAKSTKVSKEDFEAAKNVFEETKKQGEN